MSIELTPNGVACNLACTYCYQNQMREAGNVSNGYDVEAMIAGLEREGGRFSVFGGEALLTPIPVLERIFEYGLNKFGGNGIQSNGALITDAHVELFTRYKVHVGLSLDGPGELNDSRWAGSWVKTREATAASFAALDKVLAAGLGVSLIVTLYRGNAAGERLSRLLSWFEELEARGLRDVRLHLLEVENEGVRDAMALTERENITAMLALYEFQSRSALRFDIFAEMARLLMGDDERATCIWNACDPYTTDAVRGVDGHGESSNCGRMAKDGVDWRKADTTGFERQVALRRTPQSDLGCEWCRFFFACKGQCPGTAEGGDWRNRSEHCGIWMALFERIEADLVDVNQLPLSLQPALLAKVDAVMMRYWERGKNVSIRAAVETVRTGREPTVHEGNRPHGDHWDAPDGYEHADASYTVHGDAGVTQMHGDSDG